MKFGKPSYVTDQKIYRTEITDGFRCETTVENTTFTPSLESFTDSLKSSLTQVIINATKGWFSKPLTEAWLLERIRIIFPTVQGLEGFEGMIVWQAIELSISKDLFTFQMGLVEKREAQKVMIEFPEEVPEPNKQARQLTQEEFKAKVLRARDIAGRALFRAERLTQEYYQLYGEDTDFEESDTDSNCSN